jgi:hypothetical protein
VLPVAAIVHALIGVVLIGGLLAVATICALKGKWVFFALGWFSGVFWIVGAIRVAKPRSYWATRWYGENLLALAHERFPRAKPN